MVCTDQREPGRVTEARCTLPTHSQGGRRHNVNSREPFLSLNIANTFTLPPQDCHHCKNYRIVIEFKDYYQLAVSSRDSQEFLSRPVSGSSNSWGHFHLGMNIKHLDTFSFAHCEYINLSSKQKIWFTSHKRQIFSGFCRSIWCEGGLLLCVAEPPQPRATSRQVHTEN